MDELVGRDAEVAEIDRALDGLAGGPAALVLEGPAGIGKTALWSIAIEHARSRGFLVLAARPTGAEASFAYQGLADLLGPVIDDASIALPPPQQRALAVALLREAPPPSSAPGEGVEAQLVSLAATTALIQASRRAPVVVAIDDAPWLDPATASALAFVARRLGERSVGFLVTQRADEPGAAPLDLDRAIPTERRWLAPLSRGALHALLAARLGLTLPRPTLARLHEMSQGNPFHALEMGRALQRLPAVPRPGDAFPIPESLRGLIVQRLVPLSADARRGLLLAALAGSPSTDELARALGDDMDDADAWLAEAIDAGLVAVDAGRVRFSHPLIASTVAAAATETQRQAAHRALAAIVAEPEARGRHLALATTRPAADVAGALETAAIDARSRAATDTAVELYRLALDRTPASDAEARDRRRVRLAEALFDESDLPAARELLRAAIPEMAPGPLRAEARMVDGTIGWYLDTGDAPALILREALPDAAADPELLGRIHYRLSIFEIDARVGRDHGRQAIRLLEGSSAATSHAAAMFQTFWGDVTVGDPPDMALFERGLAREAGGHIDKSTIPAIWWMAIDRADLARARVNEMLEESRASGEVSGEADLLTRLAEAELVGEDWPRARAAADEARVLAQQGGQGNADPARRARAMIDVHEGRLDEAESVAAAALARAEAGGDHWLIVAYSQVLTLVAHSRGDAAAVERHAERIDAQLAIVHASETMRMDVTAERVEALVALGRLEDAARHLAALEARGRVIPRPWVDAAVARDRALLLASGGDLDGAIAATDAAIDERSASWRRYDRARTLLVRGQVLRQARRVREAGAALDEARSIFVALGAPVFAARAEAEIDRLGRRRPGSDGLTPTERRVAELAANGLRNHEVAAELAVSPKTVEAHLARIYAKLGIRSRAELGRAMAAEQGGDVGNLPMQ